MWQGIFLKLIPYVDSKLISPVVRRPRGEYNLLDSREQITGFFFFNKENNHSLNEWNNVKKKMRLTERNLICSVERDIFQKQIFVGDILEHKKYPPEIWDF